MLHARSAPFFAALLLAACGSSPGGGNDDPPAVEPAWLKGKPIGEWFQIPNTSGAGGSAVFAFSGMALKANTSEIVIAAAGGHGDSSDNRVVSIRLDQDTPTWTTRLGPSAQTEVDVPYYADGRPSSRHTYYSTHYVPQVDRVMLIGAQFVYGKAVTFPSVDGFDLNANAWDPKGTWADLVGGYGKALDSATGDVWAAYGFSVSRWSAQTRTQTVLQMFNSTFMAMQNAWDPVRNQLVSIGFGDGWGYSDRTKLNAYTIDASGKIATPITFAPSDGLTQFLADQPVSAAFEYEAPHDRFFYFDGMKDGEGGATDDGGRLYVITPHAGADWEVALFPLGPGTDNPPRSVDAGVFSRLRHVPALKGFVYLHAGSYELKTNLYFLRTG